MPKYEVWRPDEDMPWESKRHFVLADDAPEAAEQVAEFSNDMGGEGDYHVKDESGVIRIVRVDILYRGHVIYVKPKEKA